VRITVDIDSTLHHYWDQFEAAAKRRFGVDLPYEEQLWRIERLRPEQVRACVAETHTEEKILAAEPYPGAVEALRAWHEAGHFIQISSHRAESAHGPTAQWLERIGLPYDELHCSYDKLTRCRELGIELLIDDSPVNLLGAIDVGIAVATIAHPWNREVCEDEDILCARDWDELARLLAPRLERTKA
jgi:uncharacterized HAD superfamily protein